MSLEGALVELITEDAGVAAIMGTRLYPDIMPQDCELPAGFYTVVSVPVEYAHDRQEQIEHPLVQVSIFTTTKAQLVSLRAAIRSAVSGYRGSVGGEQLDRIGWREMVNSVDTETGLYESVVELRVMRRV